MKCPACINQLTSISVSNLNVEVCKGGCGGVWLDQGELAKFDEDRDPAPETLLKAEKNKNTLIDHSKARKCPKCTNQVLAMHYHDSEYQIEVDQCMGCGGIWLDLSELDQIRTSNKTQSERESIIKNYMERFQNDLKQGTLPKRVLGVFRLLF